MQQQIITMPTDHDGQYKVLQVFYTPLGMASMTSGVQQVTTREHVRWM